MYDSFSDEVLMIELGQMPAGIDLKEVYNLNKLKDEFTQSEIDIQNLMNMCQMWSWA